MRIVGAGLIIVGMTFVGRRMSYKCRVQVKELEYLYAFFLLLEGEIAYQGAILEEAFQAVSVRCHGTASVFGAHLYRAMQGQSNTQLSDIWRMQVEACYGTQFRNDETFLYLNQMGEQLGYLDKQMQVSTIHHYQSLFERRINELQLQLPKRCRMYDCLGMAAGMFITLLIF